MARASTETPRLWGPIPVGALAVAVCLLLAGFAMAVVDERTYEAQKSEEVRVQARILAAALTAALAFDDRAAAQEYIDALDVNPEILEATVYDTGAGLFVTYVRPDEAASGADRLLQPRRDRDGVLEVVAPVVQGDLTLGSVVLRTLKEPVLNRLHRYVGIALLASMASLVVIVLGAAHAAMSRANQELRGKAAALTEAYERLRTEIAERRKAEDALRQSQKMEAIGQLTGGVAHDFNNLLQVIGGSLELMRPAVGAVGPAAERLASARDAVVRGAKLTTQLLAFARRQPLEPGVINPGRLVQGMDELLRRALGEEVELETVIGGGLWNTLVDPGQVQNALLNLAINARDAMPEGGRLTIEVGNAYLDDHYAAAHADVLPGQYVMLAVTDTGTGMPPEVMERVFDPFFTTKPEGRGTGLGLSMVYGFVKQSGGHISLYSELGHGTTFKIYLPRTRQEETAAPKPPAQALTGGDETVLVVEDDEQVRATVVAMLAELGYRVLEAADGEKGLAVVEGGTAIDLLLTDVVMPGPVRSTDMVRCAQEILPGLVVLFTSGYTENAIVHGGRLDEGVNLLSKPYTRDALARKVRQVLDAAGAKAATAESSSPAPSRPLRILVVEDDALIRMTTGAMLSAMGHSVAEAEDAEAALTMMTLEKIDVLLTDVSLPRKSGPELAAEALRDHTDLRIVFATGHDLVLDGPLSGTTVLRKPFSEAELRRVLG